MEPICCQMTRPRYPEIEVRVANTRPPLLIGATRQALRRAGIAKPQIDDFSTQAFTSDDARSVCRQWVRLVVRDRHLPAADAHQGGGRDRLQRRVGEESSSGTVSTAPG